MVGLSPDTMLDLAIRIADAQAAADLCSDLKRPKRATMTAPSSDQVRTQLRRVLVSGGFANADRMRRFLEFVVEHTLSSPDKPLKEMTIGIELYAADFDPRISAVVRVDAARLRVKLREYYGSEGTADQLVIELPKGGYTPVFCESSNRSGSSAPSRRRPTCRRLPELSDASRETRWSGRPKIAASSGRLASRCIGHIGLGTMRALGVSS